MLGVIGIGRGKDRENNIDRERLGILFCLFLFSLFVFLRAYATRLQVKSVVAYGPRRPIANAAHLVE